MANTDLYQCIWSCISRDLLFPAMLNLLIGIDCLSQGQTVLKYIGLACILNVVLSLKWEYNLLLDLLTKILQSKISCFCS